MLNVNKNGALVAPLFSEGSAGQYKLIIQGTNMGKTGPRRLIVNGVAKYDAAASRGLRLTVMDYTMTNTFDQVYDVYGTTAACDSLATKINEVMATANVLFVLTSYDAIGTSPALQTAMANARSTEYAKVTSAARFSYACFGSSKHGILKEVWYPVSTTHPFAVIETAFESINSLGRTGYGKVLDQSIPGVSYTGTGYNFRGGVLCGVGTGPNDLWADEYLWLSCEARVSPDRAAAGGGIALYIYSRTSAQEWARSVSIVITDTEWTKVNLYLKRDDAWVHGTSGKPEADFCIGIYHYPDAVNVGTSEFRNLTVMRSGVSPTATSMINRVIQSDHILATRNIREGLPFDVSNRDAYWELYNSPDNLVKGMMPADVLNGTATAEAVTIFKRTLANADCTRYWKDLTDTTAANTQFVTPTVDIQPDVPYFASIWVNPQVKTVGSVYFGFHAFNAASAQVNSLQTNMTTSSNNAYFTYVGAAGVASDGMFGNWRLMCGLILPESWTAEQVAAFLGPDITGLTMFNKICTPKNGQAGAWVMANSTTKIRLRFLDYYNDVQKGKSFWALPLLIPLNTLRMSKRDGTTAFRLKEA